MSGIPCYVDAFGRLWPIAHLDAMLADHSVRLVVEQGARIGSRGAGDRWSPGIVWTWAGKRYGRQEPVALLLLLVTRFFDLGHEPDISATSSGDTGEP